jgi:hypothetical protein
VRPFDAEERTGRSLAAHLVDLFGGADFAQSPRARARDEGVERIDLLVDGPHIAASRYRQRDQPEELRADAPIAQARYVDVPEKCRGRKEGLVPRAELVPDPARPHERVSVQIDRGVRVV